MMRELRNLLRFLSDEPLIVFLLVYVFGAFGWVYTTKNYHLLTGILSIFYFVLLAQSSDKNVKISLVMILAFSLSGVNLKYREKQLELDTHLFEKILLEKEKVSVTIISDPKPGHRETYYPVRDDRDIQFILKTYRYPERGIGYRCVIDLTGSARSEIEGGYKDYLNMKGFLGVIEVDQTDCKKSPVTDPYLWLRSKVWEIKMDVTTIVERSFVEPYAALLGGMIFGDDRLFSEKFDLALRNSGTTHIIAASGFNISVLIIFVEKVLGKLINYRVRGLLAIILIWIFAIFANLSGSIIRACVMSTILIIRRIVGRPINFVELLLGTLFIIFLINPLKVRDVGLLLSVAATLGLYLVMPMMEAFFMKLRGIGKEHGFRGSPDDKNIMNENIFGNISCNLSTLPISRYFFSGGSLIAIVPNIILIPLVEYVYFFGVIFILAKVFGMGFLAQFIKPGLQNLMIVFVSVIEKSDQYITYVLESPSISDFSIYLSLTISMMAFIFALLRSRFTDYG